MVTPKVLFLSAAMVLVCAMAQAQTTLLFRRPHLDTTYIKDYYEHRLIVRAYESTKYNNFKYVDHHDKLVYKPNDHNNLGIGFTYRFLSINLGFYVPFIDKNHEVYGRSKTLDLQTHIFLHKFTIDFYGQFYKGYFLSNPYKVLNDYTPATYLRPDMSIRDISADIEYVFNDKKFSYNAAFYQNERQLKSAGSFILGGGVYHTDVHADSSLIPSQVRFTDFFGNDAFNKTTNTGVGINAGYAYNCVIWKYFFVIAAANVGAGINYASLSNTMAGQTNSSFGPGYNFTTRVAIGYNSDKYFVGVSYIRLVTEDNLIRAHTWQETNTGNFRFYIAKRFKLKKL